MPTVRRALQFLAAAALLAACSAPVTGSPAPSSASEELPTFAAVTPLEPGSSAISEPTPAGSLAAIPGLSLDAAIAWAEGFGLTCQTGLFPPNRSDRLVIALCHRQSADDNAEVDLTIQYWPDNTVLAVSAATNPLSAGNVTSDFRVAWLHWMSGLPFSGADADATLDWLLSGADCSAGCGKDFGAVSWTHGVEGHVEAVSAFVAE